MKNKPNMNMLLLLTQSIEDIKEEKLIFLLKKPVNDYSENDNPHWFWEGKAKILSGKLGINQRIAFCNDIEAESIFNSIINHSLVIINHNEVTIRVPCVTREDVKEAHILSQVLFHCNELDYFPAEMNNEENWNLLCGYNSKSTNYIKPIGLLSPNNLVSYIASNHIALKMQRETSISFRGVKTASIKGKGSKEIVGFVRDMFDINSTYTIEILDKNDTLMGQATVDKGSGLFKTQLTDYLTGGYLKYYVDKELHRYIDFSLLQDILIDINIITGTLTDAYGRQFHSTEKT